MKMKKSLKYLFTVIAAAMLMLSVAFTAYAEEVEDYEFNVSKAAMTNGSWGQSINFPRADFKASKITPDTIITIEFELDGEPLNPAYTPVELIFQNYTTADPAIWAKITPFEFDETSASFNYTDMVDTYGFDDFSGVDTICVGDTGTPMKVTKMTATNVIAGPSVTTIAYVETEEETTKAPADDDASDETAAPVTEGVKAEEEASGSIPVVPIVIGAVVVAAGVVGGIVIYRKKRGDFY